MRRASLPLLLLVAGCLGVGADHERLGDEALGRGDASAAMAEYQSALGSRGSAQLYAKLGAAALHAKRLREAAEAYRDLVADDPSRLDEAATGLQLVAEAAEHADDAAGLGAAVAALRDVAPDRLAARHALALVRLGGLSAAELVAVLPFALAASPDAGVTDSLLVVYGTALRETTACEEAMPAFDAARRRTRDRKIGDSARAGLAACGLQLGSEALTANDPYAAERWLVAAVTADSTGLAGRRARLEIGDLRRRQGDILGAAMAYQAVLTTSSTDSLGRVARERLDVLGAAVPDSN
jgi:tetratricopeptide (TPR) repeat protein